MCGKDWQPSKSLLYRLGSPPHVRERLKDTMTKAHLTRITPACAGKTSLCSGQFCGQWDHPRMCGKDAGRTVAGRWAGGSPPHVRERLYFCFSDHPRPGITPACAGKTHHGGQVLDYDGDHPRMCGKDAPRRAGPGLRWGSPPHVRERHYLLIL